MLSVSPFVPFLPTSLRNFLPAHFEGRERVSKPAFPLAGRISSQGIIKISRLNTEVLQLRVGDHLGIGSLLLFSCRRLQVQTLLADADLAASCQQDNATGQH